MVALSKKSANFPQCPLRVRAQNHRYRLGAEHCSKSNCQANLREATYAECNRLGSCSKDPTGYIGSMFLYDFVNARALVYLDPNGLSPYVITYPQEGPTPVTPVTPIPQQPAPDAPDIGCENSNATETTVQVCVRPIRNPANPGDRLGHVYLRISCGPDAATQEWAWSGGPLNPSDECKDKCGEKKQLRVEVRRFLPVNINPQDEDDSPGSQDFPIEGETHHCNTYTIRRSPRDVAKCLNAVATSTSGCCIPYHATATGEGCNSNCVAFWMASTCFGSGVALPAGDGMITPGWGKEMPKCVREAVEKAGADAKSPGDIMKR
jgi:hypothetical protein